jgi:uncharacterized protein (TIGR02145 family)
MSGMLNQQFGNYKFLSVLGEGGMAVVYLAENTLLGKKVAIKVLKQEFVHSRNIRGRFLSEARSMEQVSHAHIISVLDLIDAGDIVAIIMEYVDGQSLREYLDEKGFIKDSEIQTLFAQILTALQHVHNLGFIHRDVKPSNFMITKTGSIKLADFGIAKDVNNKFEMTETGTQMGTPLYMSPEQIKSTKDVDQRSDIYSLGVVLYEMVTGSYPFDKNTLSIPEIQVCILRDPLPSTHTFWDKHIAKATAKMEDERFQSCEEWLQAMKQGDAQKLETPANEKTLVEPTTSDKTVFEAPKVERTVVEQLASEKTTIEQAEQPKPVSETEKRDFQNNNVISKPSKNNNVLIYSIIGVVALGLIIVLFLNSGLGGKKLDSTGNEGTGNEAKNESLISVTVTDINGQSYKTVVIGNQTWMAENLNVSTFRNGDPITEAKSEEEWIRAGENKQPVWCYYNNDPENGVKYGKLYNWFAVNDPRGFAPKGWHVPNDEEWTQLTVYLGGKEIAGTKMKSKIGWSESGNGTNESGFSGLPGGFRVSSGGFCNMGSKGSWWSRTESSTDYAYCRDLFRWTGLLSRNGNYEEGGLSVRCLRD